MFGTRKYEIATPGYINKSRIFEAYGAGCEGTSPRRMINTMTSKAILIGMSTLQTVAKANSTKPEGGARKDGLVRGAMRRYECWVPGFRSVRE